jgi:hypothetical protein
VIDSFIRPQVSEVAAYAFGYQQFDHFVRSSAVPLNSSEKAIRV